MLGAEAHGADKSQVALDRKGMYSRSDAGVYNNLSISLTDGAGHNVYSRGVYLAL
jgi:hypothetical protein